MTLLVLADHYQYDFHTYYSMSLS